MSHNRNTTLSQYQIQAKSHIAIPYYRNTALPEYQIASILRRLNISRSDSRYIASFQYSIGTLLQYRIIAIPYYHYTDALSHSYQKIRFTLYSTISMSHYCNAALSEYRIIAIQRYSNSAIKYFGSKFAEKSGCSA